nr:MAG TPA: hypothetical protein [Caudoviricetes sp.]
MGAVFTFFGGAVFERAYRVANVFTSEPPFMFLFSFR